MTGTLDEIRYDDCLALLRFGELGRIAVDVDGGPVIVPVNYRLVEAPGCTWIALRTRPGNLLDQDRVPAAFEIDHVDQHAREGWSVLARGILLRVDPDAAEFRELFDPHPWLAEKRDRWLVLEPFSITGRRLHVTTPEHPISALFFA
jgi:nitroimidazol reductase NimA-like FMN-containing flavoprotein (pyridoxamine 5'-phosphate oxidase superfamily)